MMMNERADDLDDAGTVITWRYWAGTVVPQKIRQLQRSELIQRIETVPKLCCPLY